MAADCFDGPDAVIFFKPAVPEALRRLHDVAVKEAQARSLEPRHFGDEWIPHCTCDYGVDANQIAAGLAILSRHVPFEASVEEIGCVEVTSNSVAQIALATMDRTTMLAQLLTTGIEEEDKMGSRIRYRFIQGADPIADITDMLHQSYGPLASRGMRFVASHQDSAETRRRIAKGSTIVAVDDKDRIVGIVTLSEAATTRGCPFYDREDVASFGQFAVRTSHQGRGIGSKLLNLVESLAREHGVAELALDTSEHATELIEMYQAKGFRFVEYAQWKSVNYRSMVFSKTLQ